jgi:hypothetical protein
VRFSLIILLILIGKFSFTQEVVELKKSKCAVDTDIDFVQNRLISKKVVNDTLILSVELIQNCNCIVNAQIEYDSDTLIVEIKNNSELFSTCNCYYIFDLMILGVEDTSFVLKHKFGKTEFIDKEFKNVIKEEELSYENKYTLPSFGEIDKIREVNMVNYDSLKVGLWIDYFKDSEIIKEKIFYEVNANSSPYLNHFKWAVTYNEDSTIIGVCSIVKSRNRTTIECLDLDKYLKLDIKRNNLEFYD